jgi:hypothetical protein
MRKAWLLVGMLALFAGACGADPGADSTNGDTGEDQNGNANGDGDETSEPEDDQESDAGAPGDVDFPGCIDEALPSLPRYAGEKLWTVADFEACRAACPDGAAECVATSCPPGSDQFNTCANAEINACLSEPTSPCRPEWAEQLCCAGERCDLSGPDAQDCIINSCGEQRDAYQACGNLDANINPCITEALVNCLVDGTDPVDPGAAPAPNTVNSSRSPGLQFAPRVSVPFTRALLRVNAR